MTTIDTSIPLQGTVPHLADTDADPRTRAAQQRYHAVAIEHAARSETSAGVATPQLPPPAIKLDASILGPMLLEISTKLSRQQIKMGKEEIRANMKRQEVEHKKALTQIKKAIKAMAKARAERAKAKHAGLFGKIFGWIGTVATAVAGAVLIATGVGAAAGAVMIGLAVNQVVGMATGESLLDRGLEAVGVPKEAVPWVGMGITIVAILATMGMGGTAAAGEAAAEVATEAGTAAGEAAETASRSANTMEKVANAADKAGKVTGAVAEAGQGGAGIAKGVYDKEAAGDQKEAEEATAKKLEFQKFLARLQAAQSDERDRLERVIEQLNESTTRVLDMMGNQQATTEQITRNLMA